MINKAEICILPGGDGQNDYAWFDWLKAELDQKKINSYITNCSIISPKQRAEYLKSQKPLHAGSILVGHSFGALTAIKLVEAINFKIRSMVLVDPSVKDAFLFPWTNGNENRVKYLESWDWEMDLEKVRQNVDEIIILSDTTTDQELKNWRKTHREVYAKEMNAELRVIKAEEKHFSAKQEPSVLQAVNDLNFLDI